MRHARRHINPVEGFKQLAIAVKPVEQMPEGISTQSRDLNIDGWVQVDNQVVPEGISTQSRDLNKYTA